MKFLVIVAIILAASSFVEPAKSLADAMNELRQALGLHQWVAAWDVRRVSDWEVCAYSNDLNQYLPAAFNRIETDQIYIDLRDTMITAGVPWDDFIDYELHPALGAHAHIPVCTTLELGRVAALRAQLDSYFHQDIVDATITRLEAESTAFRMVRDDIRAHSVEIRAIQCSSELQAMRTVMDRYGPGSTLPWDVLGILFAMDLSVPC